MLPNQRVVRCMALLLLLFAAVDLFGIDLFVPTLCDSLATSADEDDCFCCCGHIVFKTAPQLATAGSRPSDTPPLKVRFTSSDRSSIYHPPRS